MFIKYVVKRKLSLTQQNIISYYNVTNNMLYAKLIVNVKGKVTPSII